MTRKFLSCSRRDGESCDLFYCLILSAFPPFQPTQPYILPAISSSIYDDLRLCLLLFLSPWSSPPLWCPLLCTSSSSSLSVYLCLISPIFPPLFIFYRVFSSSLKLSNLHDIVYISLLDLVTTI